MSTVVEDPTPELPGPAAERKPRHRGWVLFELVTGYGLILAVIWTPRPWQHWLYLTALAWFAISFLLSFPGWKAVGVRIAGFWRSFWIVGAALVLAAGATILAGNLHTLHHPFDMKGWFFAFAGYAVWAFAQQLLLQGYFLIRLLRILPNHAWAAATAGSVFALAHLPNPILTPATLIWGMCACLIFLKSRNIWPLAIAHAIFGICIAVTIPGPTVHNMRVGLGYLTYHAPRRTHLSQIDHTVSTVAWVMDDAPTRRSARQALP